MPEAIDRSLTWGPRLAHIDVRIPDLDLAAASCSGVTGLPTVRRTRVSRGGPSAGAGRSGSRSLPAGWGSRSGWCVTAREGPSRASGPTAPFIRSNPGGVVAAHEDARDGGAPVAVR